MVSEFHESRLQACDKMCSKALGTKGVPTRKTSIQKIISKLRGWEMRTYRVGISRNREQMGHANSISMSFATSERVGMLVMDGLEGAFDRDPATVACIWVNGRWKRCELVRLP